MNRTLDAEKPAFAKRFFAFLPAMGSCIFLVFVPFVLPDFAQGFMARAFTLAIFAMSLDLLVGYAGLYSLGHACFFGTGGYTAAVLMFHGGISSLWITAGAGILMAAIMAALIGLMVVRFTGIYFLLLTFAFGELLYSVVWKFRWFQTPGIEAIIDLPRPDLGIPQVKVTPLILYFLTLIVFVACYLLLRRMTKSRFGQILKGIRENEPRMQALGYDTWRYKYLSFVIAGLFAGVGGVFFVYEMRFSMPDLLGLNYSYLGQVMVILGGAGTIFGAVIGAFLMSVVELIMSLYAPMRWPLIMGITLVVIIMFFRGGLAPHLVNFWKGISARHGSSED
jgi:branched-chain amino acid transport system permease protein